MFQAQLYWESTASAECDEPGWLLVYRDSDGMEERYLVDGFEDDSVEMLTRELSDAIPAELTGEIKVLRNGQVIGYITLVNSKVTASWRQWIMGRADCDDMSTAPAAPMPSDPIQGDFLKGPGTMTISSEKNVIAGHGQHSHEVPSQPEIVVWMRDGGHTGTSIWRREDDGFYFASHDGETLEHADRCVLVAGQDVEELGDTPYGCDLDSPLGLFLIGVATDDDLSWLADGAEVLWDSQVTS